MSTASALDVLTRAFAELAGSPEAMRRLARAASVRGVLEREWVYELDSTDTLTKADVAREVPITGGRADLRINGTYVEFKSTKPWYAVESALVDRDPVRRDSAEGRFGSDIRRMAANNGLFVLIVSTAGPVTNDKYKALPSREDMRVEGIRRYTTWLQNYGTRQKDGAQVTAVFAGDETYDGEPVRHDALVLGWRSTSESASR